MPVSSRFWRKMPSNRPTVGKFWTPEKPIRFSSSRKTRHQPERVGAADAGQHRRLAHDRQHLARHVDDDRVGVAVGQQPGQRAAAGHPVAARVVDDDQVGAARLGALGGEARAGAGADDRLARVDLGAQPRERLAARHASALDELVRAGRPSRRAKAASLMSARARAPRRRGRAVSRSAVEQRLVRLRVVEGAALGRDHRDAPQRDEQRRRARRRGQLARRSGARARAHSSGVVRISVTVGLCT